MLSDSPMDIDHNIVAFAFSMSKQTVVNELDEKQAQNYRRLTFTEFLEFLARLVTLHFEESELGELPLEEKLEYILIDLLPIVNFDFKYVRMVVVEFSDSDDEY